MWQACDLRVSLLQDTKPAGVALVLALVLLFKKGCSELFFVSDAVQRLFYVSDAVRVMLFEMLRQ